MQVSTSPENKPMQKPLIIDVIISPSPFQITWAKLVKLSAYSPRKTIRLLTNTAQEFMSI
jgi:hypothetical protein